MLINNDKKIIPFRNAGLEELMKVVNIKKIVNYKKFEKWFSYDYKITENEIDFLKELISVNELYLSYYNEQKLSMRFVAPILLRVNFQFKDVFDWYQNEIIAEINGFTFKGIPDFLVAKGIEKPKNPFFFLQEYKKSLNAYGNPENQVLAAMLAAINLNNSKKIIGSFVIGRFWQFIILEKSENNNYEYFVSKGFDALDFENLKQIYINLQAVKFIYCK